MKAIAIDVSNKPSDFPTSKWLVKGKEYTITRVDRYLIQGGELGCEVAEIDLTGNYPYLGFRLSRFKILDTSPENIEEKELEFV